jgi:uncharacterized repeat protein (TIGR03803 family)
MSELNWMMKACGVLLLWAAAAAALPAQTFTTLLSFDGTNGQYPSGLVQATNGKLYGATDEGGANGYGTVFSITTTGTLTTLHSFDDTDGAYPGAGPIQATNGDLYGTTAAGGANGPYGTVFTITPGGALTTLASFDGTDGYEPFGLIQATNGDFYGTTTNGGAKDDGTVFKLTPNGTLTALYSFCSQTNCTDGTIPYAPPVQGSNGEFYGTTFHDGAYGSGTIFKITPSGTLTTIYNFCPQIVYCPDGSGPYARLVQSTNGSFYGTTADGGLYDCPGGCGTIFTEAPRGTIFTITSSGTLTSLHSFHGTDGACPYAGLTQGTDGNFYGTTTEGGTGPACPKPTFGCGTIFKITPSGKLTTLYSFCSQTDCTDGEAPFAGLVQDTNGTFYGTTFYGGDNTCQDDGCGTVFSLSVGLGPFVETSPTSAKVGAGVNILGTDLTGATSVTFNGTPAVFKVKSSSQITTTVPTGATTGTVQVVTPSSGTLSSNVPFTVN